MTQKDEFLHDIDVMVRKYEHDVLASSGALSDHLANALGFLRKKRNEATALPDDSDFPTMLQRLTEAAKLYAEGKAIP